jgi:hypothetical protein
VLQEDITLKDDFVAAVECAYNCDDINEVLLRYSRLLSTPERKAERALKLLKWMWIEQDITYWTGKGRQMLKRGIDGILESF